MTLRLPTGAAVARLGISEKRTHTWLLALATLTLLVSTTAQAAKIDWTDAVASPVLEGLRLPVDIQVAPDGAIWFVEIAGNVSRFDPATGQREVVHRVPDVVTGGERGLVGFALAGDFAETGAYYLYYTQRTDDPEGGINRLVRIADGQEKLLLTVPGAKEHNGGRILVAPDGNLFVSTGENQLRDPAQDPSSLLGKILRVQPDGSPVQGNLAGQVYSRGHRNVYGLALDPDTGELWATENSGWRRDEVNRIEAGGNYGYPECEGHSLNGVDPPCPTDKGYIFPVKTYYENKAVAPTGAAFWRGGFHWASLNEGSIHNLWPEGEGWSDEVVLDHGTSIFDLAVGPDDALYFSTFDGIWRVDLPKDDPDSTGPQPQGGGEGATAPAPTAALALMAALAWVRWSARRHLP